MVTEKNLKYSQACRLVNLSRNRKYYNRIIPKRDAAVKLMIQDVVGNTRKGRNKVIALVRKRHPDVGSSCIRRVYERGGFSLFQRLKRRVTMNPSNPIVLPLKANEEWGVDFMSDALVNGRKIRTLNVIDHFNRYCVGISIQTSFAARSVTAYLERLIEQHGKPLRIRTDNGPEFTSKFFQKWLKDNNIERAKIPPGRPDQNAIVERFNRSYREDVLDANLFYTVRHAQELTDVWIDYYNNERPHHSLNNQTPKEFGEA
jgi:putative transposase